MVLYICISSVTTFGQEPKDFVIPVQVTTNPQKPSISFTWPANTDALNYTIKRKKVTSESYAAPFVQIGYLESGAVQTEFEDTSIEQAVLYEYEISGNFAPSLPEIRNFYTCAGINVPAAKERGHLLLLCDSSITDAIAADLAILYADLIGDGWQVIRLDAGQQSTVAEVKSKINEIYNSFPDLKQILIIGHVPVPYSGNINPDGHNNHRGSWPADGYYGSMNSTWTDTITGYRVATSRPETINLPGDGKFDQSFFPAAQIAVGRIDFYNLPSFAISETGLLTKYLKKNHRFRHRQINVLKRALVEDNFLTYTEKFSQSAWKSYAALVGYDSIRIGQYETDLQDEAGYLWSYGNGAGIYTGASGIGSTFDFVIRTYRTVFTQLFGSYFGDWDNENNFLRSSLASGGHTLTAVWGGRPHWFFHHMAAGLPIGYSELVTINNNGVYTNTGFGPRMVHTALLGDPTLRQTYVKPPQSFAAQPAANASQINLQWSAAGENNILGYHIYRSNSITKQFQLLTSTPIAALQFTDSFPMNGNNVYMIRTVKTDTMLTSGNFANNSTYSNLSQGLFDSAIASIAPPGPFISLELLAQADNVKQIAIIGKNSKRYFAGQQNGEIKLFDNGFAHEKIYLSVPGINEGLFSFAFDPAFETSKLLYVFYTNQDGDLELSRFKESAGADTALPDGIVFSIPNPGNSRNLGGEIHFGPDGYLYISTGDGDTRTADANNAQNNNSLLGKLLRIHLATAQNPANAYTLPPDNPYGNEVYASGLRFPYRWGFDKLTGNVWIGDRGDSTIEEINYLSFEALRGANFGWPCYEGNVMINSNCGAANGYQFPVYQYQSPGNGSSVTGGTFYRGETYLALKGYYIFADANNGRIYLVRYDSATGSYSTVSQITMPGAVSDISEDNDGELYATSLAGGFYRIRAGGPVRYRFAGNGFWNDPENWSNKTIPPADLPSGSEIVIAPVDEGKCILNVPQTLLPGSKIIVENNKLFRIAGNLTIQ